MGEEGSDEVSEERLTMRRGAAKMAIFHASACHFRRVETEEVGWVVVGDLCGGGRGEGRITDEAENFWRGRKIGDFGP